MINAVIIAYPTLIVHEFSVRSSPTQIKVDLFLNNGVIGYLYLRPSRNELQCPYVSLAVLQERKIISRIILFSSGFTKLVQRFVDWLVLIVRFDIKNNHALA